MKQSIAKLNKAVSVLLYWVFGKAVGLLGSAFFWLLVLAVGGASLIAVGVGAQFGVGFGLMAGGVLAVAYGAVVLRGMSDG